MLPYLKNKKGFLGFFGYSTIVQKVDFHKSTLGDPVFIMFDLFLEFISFKIFRSAFPQQKTAAACRIVFLDALSFKYSFSFTCVNSSPASSSRLVTKNFLSINFL